MRYDMACGAAFKRSQRKSMIVGNCAITQALHIGCLYLRHLHTHNSYHMPGHSRPMQQIHKSKHSKTAYDTIPNGIVSYADGGHHIHEGDDNIEINAETIDGKNTFHSMARVVFQERSADSPATTHIAIEHKKSKSQALCQQIESLMQCDAFEKTNIRAEPTQREMVIHKLNSCKTDMIPVLDLAWCLLRLLHRGVLPLPNGVDITPNQIIPFWTGFNYNFPRKRPSYTAVTYAPIIESKPADMATVYTTVRR